MPSRTADYGEQAGGVARRALAPTSTTSVISRPSSTPSMTKPVAGGVVADATYGVDVLDLPRDDVPWPERRRRGSSIDCGRPAPSSPGPGPRPRGRRRRPAPAAGPARGRAVRSLRRRRGRPPAARLGRVPCGSFRPVQHHARPGSCNDGSNGRRVPGRGLVQARAGLHAGAPRRDDRTAGFRRRRVPGGSNRPRGAPPGPRTRPR